MRLWIDDLRPMPEDFDFWAKSADKAIEILGSELVEHVSFDHDLGKSGYPEMTGYTVAVWVEKAAYLGTLKPFTYTIHSANPVGAKNIERAMAQAEVYWRKHAEETKSN